MAFEYTTYSNLSKLGCPTITFDLIEEDPIRIVVIEKTVPKPPPPKVKLPTNDFKLVDDLPVEKPVSPSVDTAIIIDFSPVDLPPEVITEGPILVADQMPTFPGGDEALFKFLADNIKYPRIAVDEGITGRVYVTFVVDKDGSINDIKLLQGLPGGCSEEAIRVLSKMPKWSPGWHKGKLVSVQYNLPINFLLK